MQVRVLVSLVCRDYADMLLALYSCENAFMSVCVHDVFDSVSSHLHGAVVEGTFMNPENHGCHNPKYVLPPSWPVLNQLLQTGAVKTVNIAPEVHK